MPDGSPPDASPSPRPPLVLPSPSPRLPALPPLGRAEASPGPDLRRCRPSRCRILAGPEPASGRCCRVRGRRSGRAVGAARASPPRPLLCAPRDDDHRGAAGPARRTCTRRRRGSGAGGESLPGADSSPGFPDAGSPPGFRGRAPAQAPGRNEARAGPVPGRSRAGAGRSKAGAGPETGIADAHECADVRECAIGPAVGGGRGVRRRCPWRGARGGGRRGRRRRGGPRRGGAARRSCRWSRRGR